MLSSSNARDIALYLKTLKPIRHVTPGPFGPGQTPGVLVMQIVTPGQYMALMKANAKIKKAAKK